MKTLVLCLLIFSQSKLFAAEKVFKGTLPEMWRSGDIHYPFMVHAETGALLSRRCIESKSGCQALSAVKKKLEMSFTEEQLSGGKNPASLLCSHGHKGEVLILKDKEGNENSFCRFADRSIVRANDLR